MNSNFRKYILYALGILGLFAIGYFLWSTDSTNESLLPQNSQIGYQQLSGKALGTDWTLNYLDPKGRNHQTSIDSIFADLDRVAFLGNPTSEINQLNRTDTLTNPSPDLITILREAGKWVNETEGTVEITQTALDRAWSFSSSGATLRDTLGVGPALQHVGFSKISLNDTLIRKPLSLQLDFSKVIFGIGLSRIQHYLESKGVDNYFLKFGNSQLAKGQNERDEIWKTEIIYLSDSSGSAQQGWVALQNQAITGMGSTDQFYLKDSTQVSFTLDPRTGYPVNHGLLSVMILGPDPKATDAISDMLMVKGPREAIRLDSLRDDLQMLLIYHEKGSNLKQYVSPDLIKYLSFPVQ